MALPQQPDAIGKQAERVVREHGVKGVLGKRQRARRVPETKMNAVLQPFLLRQRHRALYARFVIIEPRSARSGGRRQVNGRAAVAAADLEHMRIRCRSQAGDEAAVLLDGHPTELPDVLAVHLLTNLPQHLLPNVAIGDIVGVQVQVHGASFR